MALTREQSDKVMSLLRAGRLQEARQAAASHVDVSPDDPGAHMMLANVLRASGNNALPHYRKAAQLAPSDPAILSAYANAAATNDNLSEAIRCYLTITEIQPGNAAAFSNLGVLYRQQGNNDRAAQSFRKALKINSEFSVAHENLTSVLIEMNSYEEAERAARNGLRIAPNNPGLHKNLGIALLKQELTDEALEHFQKAKQGGITDKDVNYGIALTHAAAGNFDEAAEAFKLAIAENPNDMNVLHDYAQMRKVSEGDDTWNALHEAHATENTLDTENRIRLNFALGKINNDAAKFDDAFKFYARANEMRFEIEKPELAVARSRARKVREVFGQDRFSGLAAHGNSKVKPIFVVGMPRSGTTLVEQIIASHPQVAALGEFLGIPRVILEQENMMNEPFPDIMHSLGAAEIEGMAKRYLKRVQARIGEQAVFTDKQLSNYVFVGIARVIFPEARFVLCKRNPLDNCVSCFFTDFSDKGFYSNDLKQLGEYHRLNTEMLDFWLQQDDERITEVKYENVVEDLEGQARYLIDFCGLPWNDACLRFNEMRRGVLNASMTQVRQKIYKGSVNRWKRYEKHLGPLFEGLGMDPNKA